jgi:hypothetical protein
MAGLDRRFRQNLDVALPDTSLIVSERVVVERGAGGEKFSRPVDCAAQQFSPSQMVLGIRHDCFSFFIFSSSFVLERKK